MEYNVSAAAEGEPSKKIFCSQGSYKIFNLLGRETVVQRSFAQREYFLLQKNTYLFFIFGILFFAACKKADITFGSQFLDNSHTRVVKEDTFSIDAYTVYVDSFVTNTNATCLVGIYKDPLFGLIRAKTFAEVAPPTYEDSFAHTSYDSLELVLPLNKTYYGDTTKPVTINVYRLSENLDYIDNTNIYNNSSFSYYTTPLATSKILLEPNRTDSIHIRLSDDLGRQLLEMFQDANDYVKYQSSFRNFFKGFCIAAEGDDGVVFGFTDSITMRLHYTKEDIYPAPRETVFNIFNAGYQCNNITIDRSSTAISNISAANNLINTSSTNNAGYMQYVTGTMVKLRFPYIRDVLQIPGYAGIVSAELRIKPVQGSFDDIFRLPAEMRLATTDGNNQITTNLTSLNSSGIQEVQNGSLQVDDLYGIDTYYSYDVTDYIKYLIGISSNNKYGLLCTSMPDNVATTFNRLLINNDPNSDSRTQLIIYYLSVQ